MAQFVHGANPRYVCCQVAVFGGQAGALILLLADGGKVGPQELAPGAVDRGREDFIPDVAAIFTAAGLGLEDRQSVGVAILEGAAGTGEGHAHLYVDDERIARLYGEWHHLASLPEDAETISVGLYANYHQPLAVNGDAIGDTVVIAEIAAP